MTDGPDATGELSVTLKAGKDFGDPWIVIRGTSAEQVKQRLAEALGLESHEGLTLMELTINAKQSFQAANNVSAQLGGTAISRAPKASSAPAPAAAPAPAEEQGPDLLKEIEAIPNKAKGRQFYLANRSKIDGDPEIKAAITAKMKTF